MYRKRSTVYLQENNFDRILREGGYPPEKIERLKKFEWFNFAVCYLEASKVLFSRSLEIFSSAMDDGDAKKRPETLVPAYYNLKHSLELFLKAMEYKITDSIDFSRGHNIDSLGVNLRDIAVNTLEIRKNDLQNWIVRLKESFPDLYQGSDTSLITELIVLLLQIIEKYHNYEDRKNEEYRYPETKDRRVLSSLFISKMITKEQLHVIIEDIMVLEILYHFIGALLDIDNEYLLGEY
jgi:hypothetical protein